MKQGNKKICPRLLLIFRTAFALRNSEEGKIGWILLWLLGIPLPILLVLFLLRGCT